MGKLSENEHSGAMARTSEERVRNAAARLFRERGYASTTMRDIADNAGMQAGSIYYYYPSKQVLLTAVLDHTISALAERTMPFLNGTADGAVSFRERFHAAIREHIRSAVELGDYALIFRRLVNELPEEMTRNFMAKRDELEGHWRRLFENAAQHGDIRSDVDLNAVRLMLVGAAGSANEWFDGDQASLDGIAKIVTAMLFDGLAPKS